MNNNFELRLQEVYDRLKNKNHEYLGYPLAKDLDLSALGPFLNLQINNVGDPYIPSSLGIDTKEIEQEVIAFFSNLLRAKKDAAWGYVTNGGSEGNLYGLYLAREAFPNGMVYYSESTHYSVKKNLHLLNMQNIVIRASENGEIDYVDLENTLIARRHQPAIFFLNIGSTMKEAVDDLNKIKNIIKKLAIKDFYIHCDAALKGVIAPFVAPRPAFDFKEHIDSISISGHKFIGSPIPCGIVLCKKEHKDRIGRAISYVDTKDTTITGSRNGFTPLILWYALKKMGIKGLQKRVEKSIELAIYTEKKLAEIGLNPFRNENAITVVFDKPSSSICRKYQLASEDEISHIICMPGISKEQIDAFIEDVQADLNLSDSSEQILNENEVFLAEYF